MIIMYSDEYSRRTMGNRGKRFKITKDKNKTSTAYFDVYGIEYNYDDECVTYELDDKNRLVHAKYTNCNKNSKISSESWIEYASDDTQDISFERCVMTQDEKFDDGAHILNTTDTRITYRCKNVAFKIERICFSHGDETRHEIIEYDENGNSIHEQFYTKEFDKYLEDFNDYDENGRLIHTIRDSFKNNANIRHSEEWVDFNDAGLVTHYKVSTTGEPDYENWTEYNEYGDVILDKDSTGLYREYEYSYYPDINA